MGAICSEPGCDRAARSSRQLFCTLHWNRRRRAGLVSNERCKIDGCTRPIEGRGFCQAHYQRDRLGIPMDAPVRRMCPRGSGSIQHGYRALYRPRDPAARKTGYILEHREVMAKMIGRPLKSHENPHHINGDRLDNRPENLELWSTKQPKGQRVVDKIAWAKELLAEYSDDHEEDSHYW